MSDPVDRARFRDAMSRLGASVHVLTTDGPAGRHGLTASAVCSVTDAPPTILACVNQKSGAYATICRNGVLCINMLAGRHERLSDWFGSKGIQVEDRFSAGAWRQGVTGSPLLVDAVANLDCTIDQELKVGSHGIFVCRVVGIDTDLTPEALIYLNRAYYHLGESTGAAQP